ncbi:MAG: Toxin-antitoxin system, toxin component, RelE family [Candidatus Woesebacteria bacterium GW2011_GWB1_39_12]|uniref:Toxin-antitoxin system, toxin component, RelE family n=2 Tax=Candidatus Woeseibacteriota TaxID=1752722 RepID=A0A0G0M1Y4_9BACT|nr:MAG: Toxin-antitoxin system, toxin component, RelE family [Candidatus Woesebacteria bacterium GW2011_GWA1_39_12]KKR00272.1 MAG: Toxin-antitoxin system, toxin component, RelE family [Candidatus Woesebacteria bacterium GW2011_GWB1_39_12]
MKQIYFYKTTSGREVIAEFIDRLDEITKSRVRNGIRILEKHGLELLKNRSVKKITTRPDIFELRIVGKKQIRILFTIYDANTYLLIHIFVKKTQKTPIEDIKLAQKRAKEYI